MNEKITAAKGALFDWVKQTPLAPLFVVLTVFVVYNFFRPWPPHQGRALFLLFVFTAVFLKSRPGGDSRYLRWFDYTLVLLSIAVFGYIVMYHNEISYRSVTDIISNFPSKKLLTPFIWKFNWMVFLVYPHMYSLNTYFCFSYTVTFL